MSITIAAASRRVAARRGSYYLTHGSDTCDKHGSRKASRTFAKALIGEGVEDMQPEPEEDRDAYDDDMSRSGYDYEPVPCFVLEVWFYDGDKDYLDGYQIHAVGDSMDELQPFYDRHKNDKNPPQRYYGAIDQWEYDSARSQMEYLNQYQAN